MGVCDVSRYGCQALLPRRDFLRASAGAALLTGLSAPHLEAAGPAGGSSSSSGVGPVPSSSAYEPWLEIDEDALRHNAAEASRLAGGRPLMAVVKNNAYGLGTGRVGAVLDGVAEVAALAVVKPAEALALRAAGVRKPILLLGLADVETGIELAAKGVRLSVFTDDAGERLAGIAAAIGGPVPVHAYIDTGMGRMGMRHDRALPWLERLTAAGHARVEGTLTELAESDDSDAAQLSAFAAFADAARARGVATGPLHAASSHALFFRAGAGLDLVRPGLVLYGAYPAGARALERAALRPAFRLRARVVRVERIGRGDGVSYGRNYVAERPTWVATLPVGHADGYTRQAVGGAEVLIGGRLYPVIGAVSASHTVIEVGDERIVEIGDVATLVGPDHAAVLPNTLAERAGISVYDVLMHLAHDLPQR
jgi:alanine racemase